MRGTYCYLPILRARAGAFHALAAASPLAKSRLVPLFDLPPPVLRDGQTLEALLAKRAAGIFTTWGRVRPVYVDVHDFPLDLRTSSGVAPIVFLFDRFRENAMLAVPVTGTVSDRGRDYLTAVRNIVATDARGACLRLAEDDFADPHVLRASIIEVLGILEIGTMQLDIVFDFRHVGNGNVDVLRATVLESLNALHSVGTFRNVVVSGSSVPDVLGKKDHGKIRRERRIEVGLWTQLVQTIVDRTPLVFSDYGVVAAHYVPPGKPVRVPARIRYTRLHEHVFYRAGRKEYAEICKQLTATSDFSGDTFSAGDQRIGRCAKEASSLGGPAEWIANDTNHHLEIVSAQIWHYLSEFRLLDRFSLPAPERIPWLQAELV